MPRLHILAYSGLEVRSARENTWALARMRTPQKEERSSASTSRSSVISSNTIQSGFMVRRSI